MLKTHEGNHVIVRTSLAVVYIGVVLFCLFFDKGSHNTIIVSMSSLIGTLFGVHTYSSYFGNSNTPT